MGSGSALAWASRCAFASVRQWPDAIQYRSASDHCAGARSKGKTAMPELCPAKQAAVSARSDAAGVSSVRASCHSGMTQLLERTNSWTNECTAGIARQHAGTTTPNAARNRYRASSVIASVRCNDLHELRVYGDVQCSRSRHRQGTWLARSRGAPCLTNPNNRSSRRRLSQRRGLP